MASFAVVLNHQIQFFLKMVWEVPYFALQTTRMHVFYHPESLSVSQKIVLSKEESQHCVRVLRHREGDAVFVVNGFGVRCEARITKANPHGCEMELLAQEEKIRSYKIHLAIAPTKQTERIEWFVEKACELGVDQITFLECEHSVRTKMKLERIEKITVSALKQSKNYEKARLGGTATFSHFVEAIPADAVSFIAIADQPMENYLLKVAQKNQSYVLLIGPEGDFSTREVAFALSRHVRPVSLGDSVLRTETAGLIGCHLLHVVNSL